jgi:hypothetical protein
LVDELRAKWFPGRQRVPGRTGDFNWEIRARIHINLSKFVEG